MIARGPRRPPESGGLVVLVVVTVLAWLAAPQAHRLRPVVDQLRQGALPAIRLPQPPPAAGTGGRVCPVASRVTYGSGWGAPRDGGTRQHQGIDLLAPRGTRLVAVEDGRIGPRWGHDGGNAGIRLWLHGQSGTHYFMALAGKEIPPTAPDTRAPAGNRGRGVPYSLCGGLSSSPSRWSSSNLR